MGGWLNYRGLDAIGGFLCDIDIQLGFGGRPKF